MAAWRTSWESASERLSHSAGQREKRPLTRGPASFTNKQQQSPTDSMYEEGKQQRRTDIRLSVLLRIAVEMERFLEADFFNGHHCTRRPPECSENSDVAQICEFMNISLFLKTTNKFFRFWRFELI
jgi:hypothetical protein